MGCFPVHVHRSEGEEEKSGKVNRILGWTFKFVFPKRSKGPTTSTSSDSSSAEVAGAPKLHDLKMFTLSELKSATKNFSLEKLGEGGFGAVYKGVLKNRDEKIEVAVKKLNVKGQQGQKEWLSEVTYLRMVDHPNLVKLLGYCLEDDERGSQCLLVYEFMLNKGLDDHLFSKHQVLSWEKRLFVALGTAKALAYLHEEVKPHIIYRDLKASNILLDVDFNPKLSDFGLARGGPTMGATHVTTGPVGTMGYAAPEYVQTGRLNAKSDVWSFGMVLLELVTGKKALDMNRPRSERSLGEWVKTYANDSRKFYHLIDSRIRTQVTVEEAKSVVSLAQRCSAKVPKLRPKMSDVVRQLEQIIHPGSAAAETLPDVGNEKKRTVSVASLMEISATGSDLLEAQEVVFSSDIIVTNELDTGGGSGGLSHEPGGGSGGLSHEPGRVSGGLGSGGGSGGLSHEPGRVSGGLSKEPADVGALERGKEGSEDQPDEKSVAELEKHSGSEVVLPDNGTKLESEPHLEKAEEVAVLENETKGQ